VAVGAGDLEPTVHVGADELDQLVAQHGLRVAGLGPVDTQPRPQPVDQLLGRRDTDVGGQQGVLDRLPRVLVETVARQQGQEPTAEAALRPCQPLPQPDQPGRGRLGLLDRGSSRLRDEQVVGHRDVGVLARRRDDVRTARRCGHRLAAPPTRQQAGQQADRDDGDADDEVEPVTHGDHPTSRRIRRRNQARC
jgi:hypothetical protein